MLFDGEEIERGVQQRADGADERGAAAGDERGPSAEQQLDDGEQPDQQAGDPWGKAQAVAKRIQRQTEEGQEVEQGIDRDLGQAIHRRHQASPPLRRREKRKEE